MNIYVGNLPYDLTDDEMRQLFEEFGAVKTVTIVKDKMTGRSRGFGFVEMAEDKEGQAAINGLNGKPFKGRNLRINEAHPRNDGPDGQRGPRNRF